MNRKYVIFCRRAKGFHWLSSLQSIFIALIKSLFLWFSWAYRRCVRFRPSMWPKWWKLLRDNQSEWNASETRNVRAQSSMMSAQKAGKRQREKRTMTSRTVSICFTLENSLFIFITSMDDRRLRSTAAHFGAHQTKSTKMKRKILLWQLRMLRKARKI